eukprot:513631-Rhodomonas_salina.1
METANCLHDSDSETYCWILSACEQHTMNSSFTPDVLTPPDQNEEQFPPNFGHSKLTSRNEQLERVLDDGHVGDGEKDLREPARSAWNSRRWTAVLVRETRHRCTAQAPRGTGEG